MQEASRHGGTEKCTGWTSPSPLSLSCWSVRTLAGSFLRSFRALDFAPPLLVRHSSWPPHTSSCPVLSHRTSTQTARIANPSPFPSPVLAPTPCSSLAADTADKQDTVNYIYHPSNTVTSQAATTTGSGWAWERRCRPASHILFRLVALVHFIPQSTEVGYLNTALLLSLHIAHTHTQPFIAVLPHSS